MNKIDYSLFDGLLDSVLVIDQDRTILYANEAAATVCESSVKRMINRKKFYELIVLGDSNYFPMQNGTLGQDSPTPMQEISMNLVSGKAGKVQIAVQPFKEGEDSRWVVIMRDVTLEEVLHSKYRGELEQKEGVIEELKKAKAELEDFSKNLQRLVEERTGEVKEANRMLAAIMDSLGQGFLVFDKDGMCLDIYTKACQEILEKIPARKNIQDVLNLSEQERKEFKSWMQAVYSEALPFESLRELAPKIYHHSQGKHVTLDYFAIRSAEDQKMKNLVLVATDRTNEHQAQIALEKERQYAKFVLKALLNKKQFIQFLENLNVEMSELNALWQVSNPEDFDYKKAFRVLHTIEGEAAMFSATALRSESRVLQEGLETFKEGKELPTLEYLGEFKLGLDSFAKKIEEFHDDNHALFSALHIGGERVFEVKTSELERLQKSIDAKTASVEMLKSFVENIRKEPLLDSIRHFDDVVQHVAEKQGKKVHPIKFKTDDIRIFPGTYDSLISVLVHAFRNAVDHGIEPSEEREFAGKPAEGTISVHVARKMIDSAPWLRFEITDDGQGVEASRIRKKMKEKNPSRTDVDAMSDEDAIQLIFDPGFSTREAVGEFSGRGIGMDAIKTEILDRGGWIRVETELGQKTVLTFEIPELAGQIPLARSA